MMDEDRLQRPTADSGGWGSQGDQDLTVTTPSPGLVDRNDNAHRGQTYLRPFNIRFVPATFTWFKHGYLNDVALLHMLALVEAADWGVGEFAGILCGPTELNDATFLRELLSHAVKEGGTSDLTAFRTSLRDGHGNLASWI